MVKKNRGKVLEEKANNPLPDNLLVISINYHDYVFPYEDGMAIVEAFKKAEGIANRSNNDKRRIYPIEVNLDLHPLSHQQYVEAKLLALIEGEKENE